METKPIILLTLKRIGENYKENAYGDEYGARTRDLCSVALNMRFELTFPSIRSRQSFLFQKIWKEDYTSYTIYEPHCRLPHIVFQ